MSLDFEIVFQTHRLSLLEGGREGAGREVGVRSQRGVQPSTETQRTVLCVQYVA